MNIYCCPNCKYVDLLDDGIAKKCPRCSTEYLSLNINSNQWNKLSVEEQNLAVLHCIQDYERSIISLYEESVQDEEESSMPVWRNRNGKIECPGDNCPQDCDNSCPIYINTQCAMLMSIGKNNEALELYKKAIAIADDFYDAWNNMAAIHGMNGDFEKARECYAKAHDIDKSKVPPVYGLALTNRDLGNYEESLKWCDVYDTMTDDGRLEKVRKLCVKKRYEEFVNKESLPDIDIDECADDINNSEEKLFKLYESAMRIGLLRSDEKKFVPELNIQAESVVNEIYAELDSYSKKHKKLYPIETFFVWCIYAGIGATKLWDINWNKLRRKGILKALTEKKGIYAMDEYVCSLIGEKPSTKQLQPFQQNLYMLALGVKVGTHTYDDTIRAGIELFGFGVTYELEQLYK